MFIYFAQNCLKNVSEVETSAFLLSLITILILVQLIYRLTYLRSLPPGPWGMPIVGYLPFLKRDLHLHFKDLTRKYGPVFSIQLGSQLYVVLSDYKIIRKAFSSKEFTGRPKNGFTSILDGYGIVNCDGKLWQDQRRFLHSNLRNFGMTFLRSKKDKLEEQIKFEVNDFLNTLNENNTKDGIELNPYMAVALSNVICNLLMSVRFSYNDKRFYRFMFLIEEGFRLFSRLESLNFIPFIKHLPILMKTRQKLHQNRSEMADFFQETIDEHRQSFDPNNIRDVIDAYLFEIQKAIENGTDKQLFEGKDHDRQIQQIIGDLFSAGMETIKTTMLWAVIYMVHHPEIMKSIQDELDQIVGRKRLPCLNDIPNLPIFEATLYEVLRSSSIVSLGTSHSPIQDVLFNGYKVPHNTEVIPLLHTVHMDPDLWHEPEKFNPSRFLNNEGKISKPSYFLPFGVGRRMCLGETLARMELFLFFSSLLHSFHFEVPEGQSLPNLKANFGVTLTPDAFKIHLVPRHFDCDILTLRCFGQA